VGLLSRVSSCNPAMTASVTSMRRSGSICSGRLAGCFTATFLSFHPFLTPCTTRGAYLTRDHFEAITLTGGSSQCSLGKRHRCFYQLRPRYFPKPGSRHYSFRTTYIGGCTLLLMNACYGPLRRRLAKPQSLMRVTDGTKVEETGENLPRRSVGYRGCNRR